MDSIYSAFTNAERATLDNEAMRNELAMQPLKQQQLQGQVNALNELVKGRQFENKTAQETYDRQTGARKDIAAGMTGLEAIDRTKPFAEQQAAIGQQLNVLQGLLGKATEAGLPGEEKNLQARINDLQKSAAGAQAERVNSLYNSARVAQQGGAESWKRFVDSIPATFPEYSKDVLAMRSMGVNLDNPNSPQVQQLMGNLQAAVVGQKERLDLEDKAANRDEKIREAKAREQNEAKRISIASRAQTLAERQYEDEKAASQSATAGSGGSGVRKAPSGYDDPYAGQPRDAEGNVIAKTPSGQTYKIPPSEQYFISKNRKTLLYPGGQLTQPQTSIPDSRTQAALGAMRQATAQFKQILELPEGTTSGIWGGMKPQSMLSQPLGALANAFSKSATQQYNALSAGVLPDVATAERLGFNVTQAQLEKMQDKFTWRAGDDPVTKLRKAAEFKVVLRQAAENVLNNRSITYENRHFAQDTIDTLDKLVPFSNEDVTAYERRQGKGGGTRVKDTFKDVGPKKDVQATKPKQDHVAAGNAAAEKYGF